LSQAASYRPDRIDADLSSGWTKSFRPPRRIQTNLLARSERRVLNALCDSLPEWVTPDHLTALGVVGAVITAIGYFATNWSPLFFFLASFGLIVNWFGDSLDGSLARFRKIERPRYGFFVDHSVDAASSLIISVGLGMSLYVGMDAALFVLAGYLSLGFFILLSHQVSGDFQLTFLNCGPTEMRLIVIGFNLSMYVMGPARFMVLGHAVSLHAASVWLLGAVLVSIFMINIFKTARELARQSEPVTGLRAD
jgi:archaetidylinositol phosphate synthase